MTSQTSPTFSIQGKGCNIKTCFFPPPIHFQELGEIRQYYVTGMREMTFSGKIQFEIVTMRAKDNVHKGNRSQ